MPDLGPHASFILAAYAVTALAVGGLIYFILADDRKQRQLLAELERRGITRRSAKPQAPKATAKPAAKEKRPPSARKPKP